LAVVKRTRIAEDRTAKEGVSNFYSYKVFSHLM
jgi:hypothetical protein